MNAQVLLVHGGAGSDLRAKLDPALDAAHRAGVQAALAAGSALLADGGSALDAVTAAIRVLEDDPVFNAGIGAALTRAGHAELDAAIHDGETGRAGAVTGVRRLREPIAAARLVMERSGHVLMAGAGAEAWCEEAGARMAEDGWAVTPHCRTHLQRWRETGIARSIGTVGAVALDRAGRLAAGTSTGGLTGKRPGRIGDSPLIGCGTWADGRVAVSCTGDGEAFIRACAAHTLAVTAQGAPVATAAEAALSAVRRQGGTGGLISVANDGTWAMRHTTSDLVRGVWSAAGMQVALYGDEPLH